MINEPTRTVWIRRPSGAPVRMWVLWGPDNSGLEWTDARWREFADGEYRMTIGDFPSIPFRVAGGRAYLDNGEPLRLDG